MNIHTMEQANFMPNGMQYPGGLIEKKDISANGYHGNGPVYDNKYPHPYYMGQAEQRTYSPGSPYMGMMMMQGHPNNPSHMPNASHMINAGQFSQGSYRNPSVHPNPESYRNPSVNPYTSANLADPSRHNNHNACLIAGFCSCSNTPSGSAPAATAAAVVSPESSPAAASLRPTSSRQSDVGTPGSAISHNESTSAMLSRGSTPQMTAAEGPGTPGHSNSPQTQAPMQMFTNTGYNAPMAYSANQSQNAYDKDGMMFRDRTNVKIEPHTQSPGISSNFANQYNLSSSTSSPSPLYTSEQASNDPHQARISVTENPYYSSIQESAAMRQCNQSPQSYPPDVKPFSRGLEECAGSPPTYPPDIKPFSNHMTSQYYDQPRVPQYHERFMSPMSGGFPGAPDRPPGDMVDAYPGRPPGDIPSPYQNQLNSNKYLYASLMKAENDYPPMGPGLRPGQMPGSSYMPNSPYFPNMPFKQEHPYYPYHGNFLENRAIMDRFLPGSRQFPSMGMPMKRELPADDERFDEQQGPPVTLGSLCMTTLDTDTNTTIFNFPPGDPLTIADQYLLFERELCLRLRHIRLPEQVCYVHCPLHYAFEPHNNFVRRFCNTKKHIMLLGMNPGPFGMSQTGISFGEVNIVKDWLEISGAVYKPDREHPKRPIDGLQCKRSEVSGARFWGFFKSICIKPENFFKHAFIHNHCPIAFMGASGKNITPPQLPSSTLKELNSICDDTLRDTVRLYGVRIVLGIGKFAQDRAKAALKGPEFDGIRIETLMHPSPINPTANKGWNDIAMRQLGEMGLLAYFMAREVLEAHNAQQQAAGHPQPGGVPLQGGHPQQGGVPLQGGHPMQGGNPMQQSGHQMQAGPAAHQMHPGHPAQGPPMHMGNPMHVEGMMRREPPMMHGDGPSMQHMAGPPMMGGCPPHMSPGCPPNMHGMHHHQMSLSGHHPSVSGLQQ